MLGPVAYIGSKRRLARCLLELFPLHTTYVEPFCGGAQVFFHKRPSPVEVLNDLDGELVNFLRVCQLHHQELVRWLRYAVTSRTLFDLYRRQDPSLLTDVQRAARFLYLQKTTWAGKVRGQTFEYRVSSPGRFLASNVSTLLERTATRLERVQLENGPYEQVLLRYDRPTTLFYCDPPYVEQPYYRFNFSEGDFQQLAKRLAALEGKFLLSLSDHPVSRAAFRGFHMRELPVRRSIQQRGSHAHELLFSNFELPRGPLTERVAS